MTLITGQTTTTDSNGTTITESDADGHRRSVTDELGRIPAFYGLAKATGGVYAENMAGRPPQEMLAAADLNFVVDFRDAPTVTCTDETGVEQVPYPHLRGTVATWPPNADGTRRPRRGLGIVKSRYALTQPAQLSDFAQAILDESGATCVAAGGYGNPRASRIYLAFKLPGGLLIDGQDPYDMYLTLTTSYDGSTCNGGTIAPLRVACTNQIPMIFGAAATRFVFRHTGDVQAKLDQAREILKISGTWTERYNAWCEQALNTPMTGRAVGDWVEKLLPTPNTVQARGADAWSNRRAHVADTILRGENNEFGRGTAYAAYQGIVEWAQHAAPARTPAIRYTRIMDGTNERFLHRAADLLPV